MIIDSLGMKAIEKQSGLSMDQLMENAGKAIAEEIKKETSEKDNILILCGKGNNGGDGIVVCRLLDRENCNIIFVDGEPKSEEALHAYSLLDKKHVLKPSRIKSAIRKASVIVDAIYGFGFHGSLKKEIRNISDLVNESKARVFSIDINSGAEADSGHVDKDTIRSDITFALDCFKPFHMMNKEHGLCKEIRLLDLNLPHPETSLYPEMNEEIFFSSFPKKKTTAYKNSNGKTILVGGSYGMAGALSLNIIGAKTVGASYIDVVLDESIYPIVASHHITPVFHPVSKHNLEQVALPLVRNARAIACGSGMTNMEYKQECMDLVLQNAKSPVVLDAESLRMLRYNTYLFRFIKAPVILTPHIGEFAYLINKPVEEVMDRKIEYALAFSKENKVILVLKGPNTIVTSPTGDCYINQSGNQALGQAGSGDLLTGIITGILTMTRDTYKAACMGVWLHGKIADLGIEEQSIQCFDLESFPKIMNRLFKKHGF